jgi:hypothetical protein
MRTGRWFCMRDSGAFVCSRMSPISSFLARFTQIRDELGAVGEVIQPNSLVRQALQSFTKPWGTFIQGIVAREHLPTWDRMWDEFAQEEIRLTAESSGQRQQ